MMNKLVGAREKMRNRNLLRPTGNETLCNENLTFDEEPPNISICSAPLRGVKA